MTTGTITNTRGRIVPLQNITKRTKQIALALTTDLTVAWGGATPTNVVITRAQAIFYTDSTGVWRMRFNIHVGCDATGSVTSCGVTFVKTSGKSGAIQSVTSAWGTATIIGRAFLNGNTITANIASSTINGLWLSGDVELNAEPTDYTIAANMEVAGDVVAYIPDASASNAGLINLLAQTFAGVKNFQDGIKIGGNETVITYDEGSWTPTISSSAGSITSYTSTGSYVRIGKIVVITFSYTITNNGTGSGYGKVDSLPFTIASPGASGSQRIAGTTGYLVTLDGMSGSTQIRIYDYANLYPWATNASSFGTLTYLTT